MDYNNFKNDKRYKERKNVEEKIDWYERIFLQNLLFLNKCNNAFDKCNIADAIFFVLNGTISPFLYSRVRLNTSVMKNYCAFNFALRCVLYVY